MSAKPAELITETRKVPSGDSLAKSSKRRFAFLLHPLDEASMRLGYHPSFAQFNVEQLGKLDVWVKSLTKKYYMASQTYHLSSIASRNNEYAEGWLIGTPLTAMQILKLKPSEKRELIESFLLTAYSLDVDIVGLGAFTSIITKGGETIKDNEYGLNITTGNSLTGISAAEGLVMLSEGRHILSESKIAIIGAAGSVGRISAIHLSKYANRVVLIGNQNSKKGLQDVSEVGGEIYRRSIKEIESGTTKGISFPLADLFKRHASLYVTLKNYLNELSDLQLYNWISAYCRHVGYELPVATSVNIKTDLKDANLVLSATSQGQSFIEIDWLAKNAIFCDAARPSDLKVEASMQRSDLTVLEGGLLHLPDETVKFGSTNVLDFPTGINLACLSETISIALSGDIKNYSIGKKIDYDEAVMIYNRALDQGFEVCKHTMSSKVSPKLENNVLLEV